eukprot:364317-Chlamydomonas_euryale.AAC.5
MHATSAAAEHFNSTYGAMDTAERASLALGTADKMARAHHSELQALLADCPARDCDDEADGACGQVQRLSEKAACS